MGWDCTLHVLEDASLARFAARFLHGLHRSAAFDREYDGDDLIGKVKELIATDPETGARALGELALLYVATETPHVYCRGFALSLWDEALGVAPPAKWLGTVETHITDIIAAYPKIAGRVPRRFDQNYCVGPVVSAKDVPALLAHVENALEAMAPGDRVRYRPLCDVLQVAASRNLGYWEGTDIDVIQTHEDWLPATTHVVTTPNPLTSALARPIAIAGTRMLVGEHFVLHEVDTSTFPPAVITREEMQVNVAAFTPWGTQFVRMATDREVRPFKFGYFELPDRTPLAIEPGFVIATARPARDSVLVFPQATSQQSAGVRPLVMRKPAGPRVLKPLALPDPTSSQRLECDAVAFGDGSLLVVWDGVPYRWDGDTPPVSLGGTLEAPEDLCATVALSDGSIVGGFGRKLVRIDRDGQRASVLQLDNVMAVARGPDDVLIISEGDNPEADVLKLWWPATREVTHIHLATLGLDERPLFFYFDAIAQLVVAARPRMWHAVPWSELEAMRRIPEDEFTARRTELVDSQQQPS